MLKKGGDILKFSSLTGGIEMPSVHHICREPLFHVCRPYVGDSLEVEFLT